MKGQVTSSRRENQKGIFIALAVIGFGVLGGAAGNFIWATEGMIVGAIIGAGIGVILGYVAFEVLFRSGSRQSNR